MWGTSLCVSRTHPEREALPVLAHTPRTPIFGANAFPTAGVGQMHRGREGQASGPLQAAGSGTKSEPRMAGRRSLPREWPHDPSAPALSV